MLRTLLCTLALVLLMAAPAIAQDRLVLNDGRVLEGQVIEQTENYVQMRVSGQTLTFWMGQVREVVRDAQRDTDRDRDGDRRGSGNDARPGQPRPATGAQPESRENKPGVIVLPLTGTVGMEFRAKEILRVAEEADRLKPDAIVLLIESGGGLMVEMYAIHNALMEIKQRHRVVAWVRQAISAAAATAFHCDEIYFMTAGNLGAMTGYAGQTALQGEALQRWLRDASAWAEAGGRNGAIARAMIHHPVLLSYDKDPVTGDVTWYESLEGEFKLSDGDSNLSITSSQAMHSGFADGIADTKEELARLLDLPEWHEVSDIGYRIHEEWMRTYQRMENDIPRIMAELQRIQTSPLFDERQRLSGQIAQFQRLLRWVDQEPNLMLVMAGIPDRDVIVRTIRELQKQLTDLNRGR